LEGVTKAPQQNEGLKINNLRTTDDWIVTGETLDGRRTQKARRQRDKMT